jgi:hypothetical protein
MRKLEALRKCLGKMWGGRKALLFFSILRILAGTRASAARLSVPLPALCCYASKGAWVRLLNGLSVELLAAARRNALGRVLASARARSFA